MPSAVRTDRTDCKCGARTIRARGERGLLILDWDASEYGPIAARHEASGGWTAHRLRQGEKPIRGVEKRYTEHECGGAA